MILYRTAHIQNEFKRRIATLTPVGHQETNKGTLGKSIMILASPDGSTSSLFLLNEASLFSVPNTALESPALAIQTRSSLYKATTAVVPLCVIESRACRLIEN